MWGGGERARKSERCVGFPRDAYPVAAVFENLEDGLAIDQVAALYDGLTRQQIKAVLEFAAQSLEAPSVSR